MKITFTLNNKDLDIPKFFQVVCEECGTKFSTSIEFNVSNFFGTGS